MKADATLYLSRMKQAGAETCMMEAGEAHHAALEKTAHARQRKAIAHNQRLCRRYLHADPE